NDQGRSESTDERTQNTKDQMSYQLIRTTLEKYAPDLFRALYPRLYRGADNWCSPAIPATHYAATLDAWCTGLDVNLYTQMVAVTAARLLENGAPAFHIGRDLAEALARTEAPESLRWPDMSLPFPAGIFLLPCGLVKDHAGRAYDFVGWCRVVAGQTVSIPQGRPIAFGNDALIFTTASIDDPHFAGLVKSLDATTWAQARIPELDSDVSNLVADERDVINHLARIAINALLTFDARPELREPGARVKTKTKHRGRRETWSPNWVGRSYSISRQTATGTHASPRMHWRRGHWRMQPHGPNRSEHKLIWIEPVLIGGSE
ncbi:MAG: hypothetical protein ACREEM_47395, partial [Blastocatellia bacterium]